MNYNQLSWLMTIFQLWLVGIFKLYEKNEVINPSRMFVGGMNTSSKPPTRPRGVGISTWLALGIPGWWGGLRPAQRAPPTRLWLRPNAPACLWRRAAGTSSLAVACLEHTRGAVPARAQGHHREPTATSAATTSYGNNQLAIWSGLKP